jgi:uncharacterized membrane protein
MPQTDHGDFLGKSSGDRTVMHVLYALHTIAPFTYLTLSLVALVVHYVKRSDETDAVYLSHHNYMIRTVWWALLWVVLASPLWLLLFLPGLIGYTVVALWYLYRCLRGWVRFNENQMP